MNLLSLDASGNDSSLALYLDGVFYEKSIQAPRHQGECLLPMIDEAFHALSISGHDLDGIVFGRGPGSFTGLRLTASVAQGLAVGWNKKMLALSNLAAIAYKKYQMSSSQESIFVAIDARKQEVYAAAYQFSSLGLKEVYPECVIAQEKLPCIPLELSLPPSAREILNLALYQMSHQLNWISPKELELTYLRNRVTD